MQSLKSLITIINIWPRIRSQVITKYLLKRIWFVGEAFYYSFFSLAHGNLLGDNKIFIPVKSNSAGNSSFFLNVYFRTIAIIIEVVNVRSVRRGLSKIYL